MQWQLKIYTDDDGTNPSLSGTGFDLLSLFQLVTNVYCDSISKGCKDVITAEQDASVCAWCGQVEPTVTMGDLRLHPQCVKAHLDNLAGDRQ